MESIFGCLDLIVQKILIFFKMVSPYLFTAVGAGVGAYWGGRPLVMCTRKSFLNDKKEKICLELNNIRSILEMDIFDMSVYNNPCFSNSSNLDSYKEFRRKLEPPTNIATKIIEIHFRDLAVEAARLISVQSFYIESRSYYIVTLEKQKSMNSFKQPNSINNNVDYSDEEITQRYSEYRDELIKNIEDLKQKIIDFKL